MWHRSPCCAKCYRCDSCSSRSYAVLLVLYRRVAVVLRMVNLSMPKYISLKSTENSSARGDIVVAMESQNAHRKAVAPFASNDASLPIEHQGQLAAAPQPRHGPYPSPGVQHHALVTSGSRLQHHGHAVLRLKHATWHTE